MACSMRCAGGGTSDRVLSINTNINLLWVQFDKSPFYLFHVHRSHTALRFGFVMELIGNNKSNKRIYIIIIFAANFMSEIVIVSDVACIPCGLSRYFYHNFQNFPSPLWARASCCWHVGSDSSHSVVHFFSLEFNFLFSHRIDRCLHAIGDFGAKWLSMEMKSTATPFVQQQTANSPSDTAPYMCTGLQTFAINVSDINVHRKTKSS